MKFCSNCGAQCEDNVVFCPSCGNSFDPAKASAASADPFDHTAEFDSKDISDNKVIAMLCYLLGSIGVKAAAGDSTTLVPPVLDAASAAACSADSAWPPR